MATAFHHSKEDYDYHNLLLNAPPEHLTCRLCQKLMHDPVQTIRGEFACDSCYQNAIGLSGICPVDKEPIKTAEIFKDKFKTNAILQLECRCVQSRNGCEWTGKLVDFLEHRSHCDFQPICCPLCHTPFYQGLDNHLFECKEIVGKSVCHFATYGCPKKPADTEEHVSHIKGDSCYHSMLIKKHYESISSEHTSLKNELVNLKKGSDEEAKRMKSEIMRLTKQLASLTDTANDLSLKLGRLSEEQPKSDISKPTVDEKENVSKLSADVSSINDKISSIDLKQQLYENASYDGRVLWKIDNLTHRMQQAVIGRVSALHSAPCFTSKYGYRFCGRLYLNGDGMGKCTHISVFFVLMKSEYDNLLDWPFTKRVSFRIINQEDEGRSVVESFIPDRHSASFQKPSRDMNVAAGCPMLITKEELLANGFVKDDAMFVEICVKN